MALLHVSLDRVEIDIDILKLSHQIKTRRHALSTRDGITFMGGGAYELKTLLGDF